MTTEPPILTSADVNGLRRISEERLNDVLVCVSSISRFRNRTSVRQRPGTAYKRKEAVDANVLPLGDRSQDPSLSRDSGKSRGNFRGKSTLPESVAPNTFRAPITHRNEPLRDPALQHTLHSLRNQTLKVETDPLLSFDLAP